LRNCICRVGEGERASISKLPLRSLTIATSCCDRSCDRVCVAFARSIANALCMSRSFGKLGARRCQVC
jgi:hypothetical protein